MRNLSKCMVRSSRLTAAAVLLGGLASGCSMDEATRPAAVSAVSMSDFVTETIESDTTWATTDVNLSPARSIGPAQTVCINVRAGIPARCPPGSASYYAQGGWRTDLSSIPNAYWIWAPQLDGETRPSELRSYMFSKDFLISGHPVGGSLQIAVDDYARVEVNGILIGSAGSIIDLGEAQRAQDFLTTFDIGPALRRGNNIIRIIAQNGPTWFAPGFCGTTCSYRGNPAGVVFGGWYSHTH
jgi:hypothetical protein